MVKRIHWLITGVIICTSLFLTACSDPLDYYYSGSADSRRQLKILFDHLENSGDSKESRFVILQQIVKQLLAQGETEKCNYFLTTLVEQEPDNPYNGYYLFIVAQNYMQDDGYPFAGYYFERILRNYPDLLVEGQSIHYNCLNNLLKLTQNPEKKVTYYKELLSRYRNQVNIGLTYFYLGKNYEALGEWDLATQAYINYLKYPDTHVPGVPNAHNDIQKRVKLYNYRGPDWAMEDLDDLVNGIKSAIIRMNTQDLQRFISQIDFFTTSWEHNEDRQNQEEMFVYHLGTFLNPGIRYSQELDEDSNSQEAYLRTIGWSYRIRTWYLYFKRIHFPADPEIHGKWEWAGIYFGEKPFAGSTEDS